MEKTLINSKSQALLVNKSRRLEYKIGEKTYPAHRAVYEKSIMIDAPSEVVSSFVEDVSHTTEWCLSLKEAKILKGDGRSVGTVLYWKHEILGLSYEGTGEVTTYAHGREYELSSEEKDFRIVFVDHFLLTPTGTKTKLKWTLDIGIPIKFNPILRKLGIKRSLLMPFMNKTFINQYANFFLATSLNRLKTRVENIEM